MCPLCFCDHLSKPASRLRPLPQHATSVLTYPVGGKDACGAATDAWAAEVASYNFDTPARGRGRSIDGGRVAGFTQGGPAAQPASCRCSWLCAAQAWRRLCA